ncbi:MAG: hypothetical protein AAF975_03010 [Spirochaetota bacterium]
MKLGAKSRQKYVELEIPKELDGGTITRLDVAGNIRTTWDGAKFAQAQKGAPISSGLLFDTGIESDKTYEYEVTLKTEKIKSNLVTIEADPPSGSYGHYFQNYKQPQSKFGEVLTCDDMVSHFLWGLPQTSSSGDIFKREQVQQSVQFATGRLETWLHINIFPQYYTTEKEGYKDNDKNIIYIFDKTYPYKANLPNRLRLSRKPLREIHAFRALNPLGNPYLDLMKWHVIESPYTGYLTIQPQGDYSSAFMPSGGNFLYFNRSNGYSVPRSYANGYLVRWLAGWKQAIEIPDSIRHAIALMAAINLLDIEGDGILAGLSSTSISMDGMSRSYSSTQSPTNAYYGARIGNYIKQLEELMPHIRAEFAPMPMGII